MNGCQLGDGAKVAARSAKESETITTLFASLEEVTEIAIDKAMTITRQAQLISQNQEPPKPECPTEACGTIPEDLTGQVKYRLNATLRRAADLNSYLQHIINHLEQVV